MVVLFVRLETVALNVMIHRKGILFSMTLYRYNIRENSRNQRKYMLKNV